MFVSVCVCAREREMEREPESVSNGDFPPLLSLPGSSWVVVDSPNPEAGAIHVAVGDNVVWAVTKDNKVRLYETLSCMLSNSSLVTSTFLMMISLYLSGMVQAWHQLP